MNDINFEPIKTEVTKSPTPVEEPQRGQPKWLVRLQEVEREHGGTVTHMDPNDPELVEIRQMMRTESKKHDGGIDKKHHEEQDKMIADLLKAHVEIDAIVKQVNVERRHVLYVRKKLGSPHARFESTHQRLLPYCQQVFDHSNWSIAFVAKLAGVGRETLRKHYNLALQRGEITEVTQ